MPFRCSSCGRPLYNRRRAACEFCGAMIGHSQRLSGTQREFLEKMKADEAKAHREFMEREMRNLGSGDLPTSLG